MVIPCIPREENRLLNRRCVPLSPHPCLTSDQLEALADTLFDFQSPKHLAVGLAPSDLSPHDLSPPCPHPRPKPP